MQVDVEALRGHCPLASYALAENFLAAQRKACDCLGLDPTQFTIYATIVSGNSQRALRTPEAFDEEGLPALVPVSRRAIAAATGLARETVRRQVQHLVDTDYVLVVAGGVVVRLGPESLSAIQNVTEDALESFVRAANLLIRQGILVRRTDIMPHLTSQKRRPEAR
jgi:hypothetical protein